MSTTMLPTPAPPRTAVRGRGAWCAIAALALAACTPGTDPSPDDDGSGARPPSASSSSSPEPEDAAASPPAPPEIVDGEVARSVHITRGAGGVPETADTASGPITVDGRYTVEGACSGDPASVPFVLSTAAPEQERTTLLEGTIRCSGEVETDDFDYQFDYEGPAQLTLTGTEGLTGGWVLLRARD